MKRKKGWLVLVVGAVALAVVTPRATSAQWSATAIGVAEVDTESSLLLLAGVSAGPGGRGLHPRIGVQGYTLYYDAGTRINVTAVRPYVGLLNVTPSYSVGVNAGYAFSNRDAIGSPVILSDRGDGFVLSGGWDYWGTGGPMAYQALAAHNFGSESTWLRGRGTRRIRGAESGGQTRFGAEVAYLNGRGYSGLQPGAIVEFHSPRGRILGLGAGMKFFEGGGDAVYFKVEGLLPLAR